MVVWIHHPDRSRSVVGSKSSASIVVSESSISVSLTPDPVASATLILNPATSVTGSSACSSGSSTVLSEILVLPDIEPNIKMRKTARNSRAVVVTDSVLYESLKCKEKETAEAVAMKEAKRLEKEAKRLEKEQNKNCKKEKELRKRASKRRNKKRS